MESFKNLLALVGHMEDPTDGIELVGSSHDKTIYQHRGFP